MGGLLAAPTYTINTTLIKGYSDLWSAPSCHARETDEHSTLREFLHAHDHQRAVVVIDVSIGRLLFLDLTIWNRK